MQVSHWASFIRLGVFPGPDSEGFPPVEQQELRVVAARPYGASLKSQTARITVRLRDGSLQDYFLRVRLYLFNRSFAMEFKALTLIILSLCSA
jgi:hypothetical protein